MWRGRPWEAGRGGGGERAHVEVGWLKLCQSSQNLNNKLNLLVLLIPETTFRNITKLLKGVCLLGKGGVWETDW
jgi:hypothetical protein